MLPIMILSTLCAAGSADPVAAFKALAVEAPTLFEAPRLPDPPADLEGIPLRLPEDGRCVDAAGAELGPGAYLPRAWADALNLRLEQAGMLTVTMQRRLDLLGAMSLVALDAQGNAVRADSAADAAQARIEGPSFWDQVRWVSLGIAGGIVVGFLGAVMLSR